MTCSGVRSGQHVGGRACALAVVTGLAWLLAVPPAAAQTGRQVLLLVNASSERSVTIGQHYAKTRTVPADQIIKLTVPERDEISRPEYSSLIEQPLLAWFARTGAADRILYIVVTKGIPLRIAGTGGLQGTMASVDSELTVLYRKMTGRPTPTQGRIDNPYYLGSDSVEAAKPFSHEAYDIFLVARLDGFTVADVIALIDRGKAPVSRGSFVLDLRTPSLREQANPWLETAAARLGALGYAERVILEKTGAVVTNEPNVLGYYSWGSNDAAIRQRSFGFGFVPGALAGMFVSTDGRTFTAPPDSWQIGTWDAKESYYAESPQSLAADLIRAGVTGVSAYVAEPYLDATVRPQILFPAYVSGLNLVEAYYLATPYLSWQTVVVGDPLCTPFRRTDPTPSQLDPPIDPISELPIYLSARRLAAVQERLPTSKPDAIKLALRGEIRLARGDRAGAQQALELATGLDRQYVAAQHLLAQIYEGTYAYDKAIERYRQILAVDPDDLIALNNLAYGLAVRQGQPAEARTFAQRAYTLSQGAPLIADTFGWVLHLTGDQPGALRHLQEAVAALPEQAEVRWHYAVVLAATGKRVEASRELDKALQLDAALKSRPEVTALQKTLKTMSQ